MPDSFYDYFAEYQHLIFRDWEWSIDWQASVLIPFLEDGSAGRKLRILDCACGIGTQALGLAARGHEVVGTDLSGGAVARAQREAALRGLPIRFHVADMRDLSTIADSGFDAVIAADNPLPHLDEAGLREAARSIAAKLRQGGVFVTTIRDYDALVVERPSVIGPAFLDDDGRRRIVHQVWDWIDDRWYTFHLYITREMNGYWDSIHRAGTYRALLREELSQILREAGFSEVRWLTAEESGFYQPVMVARYFGS